MSADRKPETQFEVRATIRRGDNGNWRMTLGADQPDGRRALDEFVSAHIGLLDDFAPILILRSVSCGAREFEVTRGPDVPGTPEQLRELTVWKPPIEVTGQE